MIDRRALRVIVSVSARAFGPTAPRRPTAPGTSAGGNRSVPAMRPEAEFSIATPAGVTESIDNRIVVALESDAALTNQDVILTFISLFPPTYKNHGLRTDIMEKLQALKLGLFRVPGGNYLEGNTVATRFASKNTIGPAWERPGHQNTAWGYWSTDGMGILEYLQMAEDLGAQPLLAVFAGYTLNGQHVSEDAYGAYIDEALDEIEYAIGGTNTTWGAKRAADGHPAPFNVRYVEIGNEDWFDGSGAYAWRYTRMHEAIRARYPQLKLIATTGGLQGGAATSTSYGTATPDVVDDHYYQSPGWFNEAATRYDTASRNGPRILIGEYGATEGNPTGNLRSAVGEAAFLTGLERNSDVVIGSMFAPVLVNENAVNWGTNLIGLNAAGSYGSPSYWVERLFAENTGRQVLASRVSGQGGLQQVVTKTTEGGRTTFYVKVVNFSSQQQSARIQFQGVSRFDEGTQTVITGDPTTRNTLANPNAIVPGAPKTLGAMGVNPRFTFPGSSVTVIKLVGALGDPAGPPPTSTHEDTDVGGNVPATLALTVGASPTFAPFVPGETREYETSTTANVTSTAGDAALTVSDPGHLTNGSFSLPEPLRVQIAPASWTGPVSSAPVAIAFKQLVKAGDALRTGRYSRTLTFTLSTTKP
jgi:alpha-L-arabinofuranosidase